MDRRRAIVTGITTAAVLAVAAVAIPAVAEEGPTRRSAPSADAAGPAPELIAALRRDLDLSADQAHERLRKEEWASRMTRQLSVELGADYGGSWLSADGTTLTVAVTDPAEAARVRAVGAEPKTVGRSAGQLDTIKASLDRNAAAASPDVAGWYVDVAGNRVVVLAAPGTESAVGRFVADSGLGDDQVEVLTSTESPRPLFDVIGGEAFFIGNARCSVGFSVVGGFVTAGHCGAQGATTSGANRAAQGVFAASSFPGDDWGVVRTNDDWVPQGVVRDFNGGTVPVAGSQPAPVGSSVCRSGSTTGTRCGVIQALNTTVNYPEGTVTGLTRTNVCAEPGDSGGSFISGDQAQGVTSGGSGNCTVGGTTFFQPVNEILAANNLTLVTAGEAPPAGTAPPTEAPPATEPPAVQPPGAEPPAAGDCAGSQVDRAGALRSGRGQIQPSGRFFRAPAGRHTACLDGPDGADFDLYLQRWSGGGWRTVARATGSGADEQLSHRGPAGVYRYRVQSDSGSGRYVLGFSVR
ncbi:alpha-lytic protease prodomain-containing protein [Solwaraspora sp. WMMD1047]|uniref:S1 family peptidase n=1 Tax=Solwaraspora sp. WMMD1047 TaxID=3016102 RepID=UPI0024171C39|nr:alpha-lytic protease prodomain-containing protein [Solwaraspora sp. WMMD1047]MDG4829692.1 alpha-lytic protease prodomain-containing protein [Solwaraspora sp. WMMD1047]